MNFWERIGKKFEDRIQVVAVTHGGTFHADDVMATALLYLFAGTFGNYNESLTTRSFHPGLFLERTFDPDSIEKKDIVFDIGREYDPSNGKFDHHQADSPVRENGVPFSSIGMLWKEIGPHVVRHFCHHNSKYHSLSITCICDWIDKKLIQSIDAIDTGYRRPMDYTFEHLLDGLNRNTPSNNEVKFYLAVDLFRDILVREILQSIFEFHEADVACTGFYPGEYVVFNKRVSQAIAEEIYTSEKFMMYPNDRGEWSIWVLNDSDGKPRCPFPTAWLGASEQELVVFTGIKTFKFCHKAGFIASTKTEEDARDVIRLVLYAATASSANRDQMNELYKFPNRPFIFKRPIVDDSFLSQGEHDE